MPDARWVQAGFSAAANCEQTTCCRALRCFEEYSCCGVLCRAGGYPTADSLTVTSFPKLQEVLTSMHEHAGGSRLFCAAGNTTDSTPVIVGCLQAAVRPHASQC